MFDSVISGWNKELKLNNLVMGILKDLKQNKQKFATPGCWLEPSRLYLVCLFRSLLELTK